MTFLRRMALGFATLSGCGPTVGVPDGPDDTGGTQGTASTSLPDASATSPRPTETAPPSGTSSDPPVTPVDPTTVSGSTSSASDSDEYTTNNIDTCGFLGCSDLPPGTTLTPCDPLFDPDCGRGRKCTYDYHPKGGSFVCADVMGDGEHGDACETDLAPYDSCAEGFSCQLGGACEEDCCVQLCDLELEDPGCDPATPVCQPHELFDAPLGVCG